MKHTINGEIGFKFYNKFVQSVETPCVRELFGSHIGDYLSNPNDKLKKAITLAEVSGIIKHEKTIYRHNTREKLTEGFFRTHMNYLKELLPNEIKITTLLTTNST